MFIVEDVTYNICDQKFHEFEIRRQNPDVFVIRKTLTEVANEARLGDNKELYVGDGIEVAVIYFRCGYHPDQYPTEKEWEARLLMERSLAIKSPSIQYHLAGTKKVQQALAKPGALERFFDDNNKIQDIRGIFTGLYSLDNVNYLPLTLFCVTLPPILNFTEFCFGQFHRFFFIFQDEQGNKSFDAAMANPDRFVLKPQREGGGNNVYGQDIVPFLEKIKDDTERNAYILMDRISPPITMNYLIRPGSKEASLVKVISELGIFGYLIGDANTIRINKEVGHMLRTKLSHVNEGGVAAGLGALDSVILVDKTRCCRGPCGVACDCCACASV